MLEWTEIIFRWILGLQLVFWGLNGFFHWKEIPPSTDFINEFSDVCFRSRFILPTVKIFEIVFGALLLTGAYTLLALVALAPIIFVISGLHLLHNKKSWEVLLPITLPFLIIVILYLMKSWADLPISSNML